MLARYGVETLLVERRRRLSGLPRATVVSTRTMELMRSWGLEDRGAGRAASTSSGSGGPARRSRRRPPGGTLPLGLPTREQSALISPTGPACVPQDHLEPVLLRHLRSRPSVRVALGAEVGRVDNGPDGVRALLRDRATGSGPAGTRATWSRPTARTAPSGAALEIAMRGPDDLAAAVSALFRAPLWDLVGPHRYGLYDVTHPERRGRAPAGGPGRSVGLRRHRRSRGARRLAATEARP